MGLAGGKSRGDMGDMTPGTPLPKLKYGDVGAATLPEPPATPPGWASFSRGDSGEAARGDIGEASFSGKAKRGDVGDAVPGSVFT